MPTPSASSTDDLRNTRQKKREDYYALPHSSENDGGVPVDIYDDPYLYPNRRKKGKSDFNTDAIKRNPPVMPVLGERNLENIDRSIDGASENQQQRENSENSSNSNENSENYGSGKTDIYRSLKGGAHDNATRLEKFKNYKNSEKDSEKEEDKDEHDCPGCTAGSYSQITRCKAND